MKFFKLVEFIFLLGVSSNILGQNGMDPRIDSIMELMTLSEKIGQLNLVTPGGAVTGEVVSEQVEQKIREGQVGGIFGKWGAARARETMRIAVEESRLGIPLLLGLDVIHGHQTLFPIPLAISCSWDTSLIRESARQAAIEASANGVMWTFSPMVDIARDPRWGRIAEGAGEDPFLGSMIAKAMVEGYQGNDLKNPETIMACVKHFANYGAPEGGRDYGTVDMSRTAMLNDYLPPYQAAVNAGVGSIMTSFNVVDYVPASASSLLFQDILRDDWQFEGLAITDYTSINEMTAHGIGDLATVAARSIEAGIDMDMVGEGFLTTLEDAVNNGLVTSASIDRACRRVLEAKMALGLFDDPYRYCDTIRENKEVLSSERKDFARKLAAETMVLLKNESNLLPLKEQVTIALIGPLADSRRNMLGTWSVAGDHSIPQTVREAFEDRLKGKGQLLYAKGANISNDESFAKRVNAFGPEIVIDERSPESLLKEAIEVANQADVIVAVVGEAADMSGEASSMADISLQPAQKKLLEALKTTGKPVVMLLFNGRPMTLPWEAENMTAILDVWFGGTMGASAIADLVFGDVNPSGKLTTSFPRHVGQVPVYHSMLNTGRPDNGSQSKFRSNYLDIPNDPLFPFGYGLSYTKFTYSEPNLLSNTLSDMQDSIQVRVTITNTGERPGKETVQMYLRDVVASISRPMKQLKGFQKIELQPGESKQVEFTIGTELLGFYDDQGQYKIEPGQFEVMVGPNAQELKSTSFVLGEIKP